MKATRHQFPALQVLFFLLLLGIFPACTTTSALTASTNSQYRVGVGDLIQLTFNYHPDLNQTLLVGDNGVTVFETIGQMSVRGLTELRLSQLLKNKYADVLASSDLDVEVQRSSNFTVYLGGQILRPGVLKFNRDLTVMQSILLAGGIKGTTNDCDIYVFRNRGDKGTKKFKVALQQKNVTNSQSKFKLQPYDVVFIMKKGREDHKIGTEV